MKRREKREDIDFLFLRNEKNKLLNVKIGKYINLVHSHYGPDLTQLENFILNNGNKTKKIDKQCHMFTNFGPK
jgi:hypothetical protein